MSPERRRRLPRRRAAGEPPRRDKGATQSRTGLSDRLRGWLDHHQRTGADSFRRLLDAPAASIMTWLVIGIALALPGALFVALQNLESISRGWDGAAQMSLFLEQEVAEDDGRALARKLESRDDVLATRYISRQAALEEFRTLSGYGEVLDDLEDNPLPAVISLRPREEDTSAETVQRLFGEMQEHPQVERAVLDLEWVQRLYSLMELGRRLTLALALLLSLGVVLVIGNTIRLAIESRRDEVVVVKLVGGTDAFVRRPFLYTGLWYGLGGGILAWLIISVTVLWLGPTVAELADLYDSDFTLAGLGAANTLALWVTGALLGWLGAWLAVGRHLSAIEPH